MNHQVYVGVHVRDSPHDSPPAKWPLPIQNHSKWLAGTWERTTPARNDQINVQDRKNWKKWQNGMAKVEGSNFGRVSHRFIMFQHVTTSLSDTTWEPGKMVMSCAHPRRAPHPAKGLRSPCLSRARSCSVQRGAPTLVEITQLSDASWTLFGCFWWIYHHLSTLKVDRSQPP